MSDAPPRWILWILDRLVSHHWCEDLKRDLMIGWRRERDERGPMRADVWLVREVVRFENVLIGWMLRRRARPGVRRWDMFAVRQWIQVGRGLARRPGMSLMIVIALAFGIGANTAIFSLIEAVVLRSLPYPDGDRLVSIWGVTDREGRQNLSGPEFDALENGLDIFEVVVQVKGHVAGDLRHGGEPERIGRLSVSWDYFDLYGVPAALGRTFTEGDDILLPPSTVTDPTSTWPTLKTVVSHDFWVRRFGSDPAAVGTVIEVSGRDYEIVGVMPEGFRGFGPDSWGENGVYSTWYLSPYDPRDFPRDTRFIRTLAKLRPGVTLDDAQAALDRFAAAERDRDPIAARDSWRLGIALLEDRVSENAREPLFLLLGAVGLVLLIACTNVATLLLARSSELVGDLRIRRALGATRTELIGIALSESLLLALAGAALGVAFAAASNQLLITLKPAEIMRADSAGLNPSVLAFTLGLGIATALLSGLLPAFWGTRLAYSQGALRSTHSTASGFKRVGSALVMTEIALALILTVGAALLLRSFASITSLDPGFTTDGVQLAKVTLRTTDYPDATDRVRFYRDVVERLEARPDVATAGAIADLPLEGGLDMSVTVQGRSADPLNLIVVSHRVLPGALETMEIPLLEGRFLDWSDMNDENRLVGVVDESFARRAWPGGDAVGRTLQVTRRDYRDDGVHDVAVDVEVIGVVGTVRNQSLRTAGGPTIWISMFQNVAGDYAILARGSGSGVPDRLSIRRAVHEVDPDKVVFGETGLGELAGEELATLRFALVLVGLFGGLGIVLSVLGVYGVMSFTVRQRSKELHIRAALGAGRSALMELVLRHTLYVAAGGIVMGWAGAYGLSRFLANLVFGVSPVDPLTYLGVAALLTLVALLAGIPSGRRAGSADPARALRSE